MSVFNEISDPFILLAESSLLAGLFWVYEGDEVLYHAYPKNLMRKGREMKANEYTSLCEKHKKDMLSTKAPSAPNCPECVEVIKESARRMVTKVLF